jgi:hypothetical protein
MNDGLGGLERELGYADEVLMRLQARVKHRVKFPDEFKSLVIEGIERARAELRRTRDSIWISSDEMPF